MESKKKTNFFLNLLRHPMITAIFGTLIGGLVTYQVTAINVEKATVELMSSRLAIVEENDTLEQAINKVNKEVDEKNSDIEEKKEELKKKDQEIAELTKQLNDDTEIKALNEQIVGIQQEKDKVQTDLENLQKDKDALQAEFDKLLNEGYEAYVQSKQSLPISLKEVDSLKNEGIRIDNAGSVSAGGKSFSYYIDTNWDDEAYIEYNLDNKYSQFKGVVYVSKWAYENYDANSPTIGNASISLQVKYNNMDDYQELTHVSGLSANSDPVEIGCNLTGVTRFKIVFRGCGAYNGWHDAVLHLGEPVFYKTVS